MAFLCDVLSVFVISFIPPTTLIIIIESICGRWWPVQEKIEKAFKRRVKAVKGRVEARGRRKKNEQSANYKRHRQGHRWETVVLFYLFSVLELQRNRFIFGRLRCAAGACGWMKNEGWRKQDIDKIPQWIYTLGNCREFFTISRDLSVCTYFVSTNSAEFK